MHFLHLFLCTITIAYALKFCYNHNISSLYVRCFIIYTFYQYILNFTGTCIPGKFLLYGKERCTKNITKKIKVIHRYIFKSYS